MVKVVHRNSGKMFELEEKYLTRYEKYFKLYVKPKKRKALPKKVVESEKVEEVKEDKE